ncbi:MAG: AlpA family phage regulatory protein [Nitrosomonas sp.]
MQKRNKHTQEGLHSTERQGLITQDKASSLTLPERLLPLPEVESRSGFKSSFIYQLIKEGKFPKPVKIGTASRWRESEVRQWIHAKIKGSSSDKHSGGSCE